MNGIDLSSNPMAAAAEMTPGQREAYRQTLSHYVPYNDKLGTSWFDRAAIMAVSYNSLRLLRAHVNKTIDNAYIKPGYNPANDPLITENIWMKDYYPNAWNELLGSTNPVSASNFINNLADNHRNNVALGEGSFVGNLLGALPAGLTDPINFLAPWSRSLAMASGLGKARTLSQASYLNAIENTVLNLFVEPLMQEEDPTRTEEDAWLTILAGAGIGAAFPLGVGGAKALGKKAHKVAIKKVTGYDTVDEFVIAKAEEMDAHTRNTPEKVKYWDELAEKDAYLLTPIEIEKGQSYVKEAMESVHKGSSIILGFSPFIRKWLKYNPTTRILFNLDPGTAAFGLSLLRTNLVSGVKEVRASIEDVITLVQQQHSERMVVLHDISAKYLEDTDIPNKRHRDELYTAAGLLVRSGFKTIDEAAGYKVPPSKIGEGYIDPFEGYRGDQRVMDVVAELAVEQRKMNDVFYNTAERVGFFTKEADALGLTNKTERFEYLTRWMDQEKLNSAAYSRGTDVHGRDLTADHAVDAIVDGMDARRADNITFFKQLWFKYEGKVKQLNQKVKNGTPREDLALELDTMAERANAAKTMLDQFEDPRWHGEEGTQNGVKYKIAEAIVHQYRNINNQSMGGGRASSANSLMERKVLIEDRFLVPWMHNNLNAINERTSHHLVPQLIMAAEMIAREDRFRLGADLSTNLGKLSKLKERLGKDKETFKPEERDRVLLLIDEIMDQAEELTVQDQLKIIGTDTKSRIVNPDRNEAFKTLEEVGDWVHETVKQRQQKRRQIINELRELDKANWEVAGVQTKIMKEWHTRNDLMKELKSLPDLANIKDADTYAYILTDEGWTPVQKPTKSLERIKTEEEPQVEIRGTKLGEEIEIVSGVSPRSQFVFRKVKGKDGKLEWKWVPGKIDPETIYIHETRRPVRETGTAESPKASLPMTFQFGKRGTLPAAPGVKSKSTLEAILRGERTATSRKVRRGKSVLDDIKPGDIIEFTSGNKRILVEVTQKRRTDQLDPKEWAKAEGYDSGHALASWKSGPKYGKNWEQIVFKPLKEKKVKAEVKKPIEVKPYPTLHMVDYQLKSQTTGRPIAGQYNKPDNQITLSKPVLEDTFKAKAWTKPKVKGVKPLPKDQFKTLEEWTDWVYAHEAAHARNPRQKYESLADYENRINKIATREYKTTRYVSHSGGAKGADAAWRIEGKKFAVKSIDYQMDRGLEEYGGGTTWKTLKSPGGIEITPVPPRLSLELLRDNPEKIYLFDDNLAHQQEGFQTQYIIRDEPNAHGIPTRKNTGSIVEVKDGKGDFFEEGVWHKYTHFFTDKEFAANKKAIDKAFDSIPADKVIVIPPAGLGITHAELNQRAPRTFKYLQRKLKALEKTHQVEESPIVMIDKAIEKANKTLKRRWHSNSNYVKNLIRRNYYQVENSEAVFAIGNLNGARTQVDGGTGWAVQMGIDMKKSVFVFDQITKQWYKREGRKFVVTDTPTLTKNFAGIGSRKLTPEGKQAIKDVYDKTFAPLLPEDMGPTGPVVQYTPAPKLTRIPDSEAKHIEWEYRVGNDGKKRLYVVGARGAQQVKLVNTKLASKGKEELDIKGETGHQGTYIQIGKRFMWVNPLEVKKRELAAIIKAKPLLGPTSTEHKKLIVRAKWLTKEIKKLEKETPFLDRVTRQIEAKKESLPKRIGELTKFIEDENQQVKSGYGEKNKHTITVGQANKRLVKAWKKVEETEAQFKNLSESLNSVVRDISDATKGRKELDKFARRHISEKKEGDPAGGFMGFSGRNRSTELYYRRSSPDFPGNDHYFPPSKRGLDSKLTGPDLVDRILGTKDYMGEYEYIVNLVQQARRSNAYFQLDERQIHARQERSHESAGVAEKNLGQAKKDLSHVFNNLLNRRPYATGGNYSLDRTLRVMKNVNYLRYMGMVTIASLGDFGNAVGTLGLGRYMRTLWTYLGHPERKDLSALSKLVAAFEISNYESRSSKLAGLHYRGDSYDPLSGEYSHSGHLDGPYGKFIGALDRETAQNSFLMDKFNKYGNFLNRWNAFNKRIVTLGIEDFVMEAAIRIKKGETLADKDLGILKSLKFNESDLKTIANLYDQHGGSVSTIVGRDFYVANSELWENAGSFAFHYQSKIKAGVDGIIVTPTAGSNPAIFKTSRALDMITQFKSFLFASADQTLLPAIQRGTLYADPNQLLMMLGSAAGGTISYVIYELLAGRDPFEDGTYEDSQGVKHKRSWQNTMAMEGIDRGGTFALLFEANNTIERQFGFGLHGLFGGKLNSKYRARTMSDTFGGPSYALLEDMNKAIGGILSTEDLTKSQATALRRLTITQNAILTKLFFDVMPSLGKIYTSGQPANPHAPFLSEWKKQFMPGQHRLIGD